MIKNLYNKDRQAGSGDLAIPNKKVGYASVLLDGENTDTIIVIDTKQAGYSITVAEIASITMLYYTMVNTAYWLSQIQEEKIETPKRPLTEEESGND